MLPLHISKAAAARILNIKSSDVEEVRIYKNRVLCRYIMNKGDCCTFISLKAFRSDFLDLRVNAYLRDKAEVYVYPNTNFDGNVQASVKFENSHDSHYVEIINGAYRCDCQDFRRQLEFGNGFRRPVCKHLKPISNFLGFGTFAELVNSTKSRVFATI